GDIPTGTPVPTPIPTSLTSRPSPTHLLPVPTPTPVVTARPVVAATVAPSISRTDPDLEPGYPVKVGHVWVSGNSPSMVVGNIDNDPQPEIVLAATRPGRQESQIVALKADGSVVSGWPVD